MRTSLFRFYFLFVFLIFVFVFAAVFLPFLYGLLFSFAKTISLDNGIIFLGLNNYVSALYDPQFLKPILLNLKISLFCTLSVNFLAFIFAFLFTRITKLSPIPKFSFLFPALLGVIPAAYIIQVCIEAFFAEFLNPAWANYGALAGFFAFINWKLIGIIMLVYIFALINLRKHKRTMDAAKLEGASPICLLLKFKLPLISTPIMVCVATVFLFSLKFSLRNITFPLTNSTISTNIYSALNSSAATQIGLAYAQTIMIFIVSAFFLFFIIKGAANYIKDIIK
ncbi:MAG: hypothetical protein LBB93_05775 [Elusimicrobiota bacterium]|jgi:ABC-type sugar transport system permease subunit|nr:hypothetical protein [Elusimicrobiota bacterium]